MVLNEENFELFAAQNYNNPACYSTDEFREDLNRFRYLKRMISRYLTHSDLNIRLVLNHTIILYNVFGIKPCTEMFFYRLPPSHWSVVKTMLIFLKYIKEDDFIDIPLDQHIIKMLRSL